MALILLVEDEPLLRWGVQKLLEHAGHTVHQAACLAEAADHLKKHRPDVVLLDVRLPDGSGLDFLADEPSLSESFVVVVTASSQVEDAVRAMKLGAFDFLSKPVEEAALLHVVSEALERRKERNAAERSLREAEKTGAGHVISTSEGMRRVLGEVNAVAESASTTVLILGETGTGKEVVARALHARSPRRTGPLLVVNCAALPETLVESELFGHERGAFTDARETRKGIFELADGGTVVLDEIGELPLGMQAKLLRFLEDRNFRRIGGSREISVDVRLVALTNRDLEERSRGGEFRSDLYYRLAVFPITVPPLRDRKDDVLPLATHFLLHFGAMQGKSFTGISPEFERLLLAHDWPGNVRELRNLMERVSILEPAPIATGRAVRLGDQTAAAVEAKAPDGAFVPIPEMEFTLIVRAMQICRGNQSAAARMLGISRDQVRYRIKRWLEEGRWPEGIGSDDQAG